MNEGVLVRKVANAEDEATGDAFEVFRFKKVGKNRYGAIPIQRDKARDAQAVRDLLVRKNADLPVNQQKAEQIVAAAIAQPHSERRFYAARLGWRRSGKGFVTPRGTITNVGGPVILPPLFVNDKHHVSLRRRGSLSKWQAEVAKPSGYSDAAMLAIAAAFAAPLLKTAGLPSFGVNLYGRTKVGKTAALLAGASTFGIGTDLQLPNWGSTAAARIELPRMFNDMMMPVNEVGLIAGKKKEAFHPIREFIYAISEGRDRARHSASQYATQASSAQFRTIFVSTAEHSFDEYARDAGVTRDDGEYARCLDVPAHHPRRSTIIDRRPRGIAKDQFRRWARRQVIKIRQGCEANQDQCMRPYIEYLIEQGDDLKDRVSRYVEEFWSSIPGKKPEGVFDHAAKNFGLLYAGGRHAIDAGVLPWRASQLRAAIISCFRRALAAIAPAEDLDATVRKVLKDALDTPEIVEHTSSSSFGPEDYDGYYVRAHATGQRTYTIRASAFSEWFDNDRQKVKAALLWLKRREFLRSAKPVEGQSRSVEWAQRSPRWPNGKNARSFIFADPFGRLQRELH